IKAIFFTVLADSFIAFILGGIMFILNVSVDISGAGVSNFDSIYYYLMSIMIMIISSAVFLVTALLYFLTLLTIFIINKLKSRENDPLPRKTQVHKG
ncbi:MAG: hypothetical protein U0M06_08415, partial [Clostridia bacterium]|nr:hypothetical protein [Clostridia bacterium]